MPVESYEDDDEEQEGPRSSFGTYLAEGDALFKQSEYKKALESYSLALELQPNDKTCLVARSKCYLKLGDPKKALQDAEDALKEDKEFNKGLYRKAEALYSMGDFEYALMYYHRGHKLRPELDEFRLGIQKAQEAIDNSIGSAAKIKLENKGDLSFFTKQDDIGNKKRAGYVKPVTKKLKPLTNRNKEVKPMAPSKKTVKQLLGELYSDKEYFEKLMEDESFIKSRHPIHELVQGGLNYLETRTEFWRQQKPLYARKKEKPKYNVVRKKGKPNVSKFVLKQLEETDQALAGGDPDRSLRLAQKLLKSVEGITKEDLPNKEEVVASIHSCIGNSYIELEQLTKALRHHEKDLLLSRQAQLPDGESRALDNVGRVHARMGNFKKAVDSWTTKLPLVKAALESTWLCHEIGRCHLELGNNQSAKEFGKKSYVAGKDCEDVVWQLNALVLIAQSEVKLGEVDEAIESFESALGLAISLDDDSAQVAISKALAELQRRSSQSKRSDRSPGSQDDVGRTSQGSVRVSSPSDDEGSPRIKSDMDRHSDVDPTPPDSRASSVKPNDDVQNDAEEDSKEKAADEVEKDSFYENVPEKETSATEELPHDNNDLVAAEGEQDANDNAEEVSKEEKTVEEVENDSFYESGPEKDTSATEELPHDNGDLVAAEGEENSNDNSNDNAEEVSKEEKIADEVDNDSFYESGPEKDTSATEELPHDNSDLVAAEGEQNANDNAEEVSKEEKTADEVETDSFYESGPEKDQTAKEELSHDNGDLVAAEGGGNGIQTNVIAIVEPTELPAEESSLIEESEETETGTGLGVPENDVDIPSANISVESMDRISSAEQLSVNPSYSEDLEEGTISQDNSQSNIDLAVESVDSVPTPLLSAEEITSSISGMLSEYEPEKGSSEKSEKVEAIQDASEGPEIAVAGNSYSDSFEAVVEPTLSDDVGNAPAEPISNTEASIEEDKSMDEVPQDVSQATLISVAEELPRDESEPVLEVDATQDQDENADEVSLSMVKSEQEVKETQEVESGGDESTTNDKVEEGHSSLQETTVTDNTVNNSFEDLKTDASEISEETPPQVLPAVSQEEAS